MLTNSIKILLLLLWTVFARGAGSAVPDSAEAEALDAATHDLCSRDVAMLGESATHGDGHTEAFKVALVERLVNECGFDSVFFEASHYEFLNLARRLRTGQAVTADDVFAAVGGLWRSDREFQPLVQFLLARAQAGRLSLGGMDDQLGQMGQDYANVQMITELSGVLPAPQRSACSLALHRRIFSEYSEAAPYAEADRSEITACLSAMQAASAVDKAIDRAGRGERQEMLSAIQRWIDRDFRPEAEQTTDRDRSMFQDFAWLRQQQPRRHKVIVWAATVHIAKQGDPTSGDHTGKNFGSYVHQAYGAAAFSLGFSALNGSFRQGRRDVHDMPPSPLESVEAQALRASGSAAVYVGPAQLAVLSTAPGAIFRHAYQTLPWSAFVDGVVVFREERPPTSSR